MADEMQRHHASNQSIKLALKGTYEFFKVVSNAHVPQSSINSLLRNENKAQSSTQIFSTPLSEIEAKELDWLWMKRIPQGKITFLEGDPGMGKSLLALEYTTLENYAESQKRMEERRKELKEDLESLKQSFTSRSTVTSDANKKESPKESSN